MNRKVTTRIEGGMQHLFRSTRWRLALQAGLLGALIPLVNWFFESRVHHFSWSLESLRSLHQMAAIWVGDSVPFILGACGYALGKAHERLQARVQELQASQTRIRSILDSTADGIVTLDERGSIQSVNRVVGDIFGYLESDLVGRPFTVLLDAAELAARPEVLDLLLRTEERGQPADFQLTGRRRSGETFTMQLRIRSACDPSSRNRFYSCALQDVSEKKQVELQLHQAQKLEAIGQLAAGIAHEINTPVQYISDNLQSLKENFEDLAEVLASYQATRGALSQDLRDSLTMMEEMAELEFILADTPAAIQQAIEGTERVAHIVRAMKDFAHIDHNRLSLVDINQTLESTLTICHNEYKYVADVVTDFGELPRVECYASELSQVFLNLIVNASHAIAEKGTARGTIRIATRAVGDEVEIVLADTGCGIPQEIRNRVFDPFFTTKEVGRGTGQGLNIAHQVIRKHKGTITFESEPSIGTTFYIRIPVVVPAVATEPREVLLA